VFLEGPDGFVRYDANEMLFPEPGRTICVRRSVKKATNPDDLDLHPPAANNRAGYNQLCRPSKFSPRGILALANNGAATNCAIALLGLPCSRRRKRGGWQLCIQHSKAENLLPAAFITRTAGANTQVRATDGRSMLLAYRVL